MAKINLTNILICAAVFICVWALLVSPEWGIYPKFLTDNSQSPSMYQGAFNNVSDFKGNGNDTNTIAGFADSYANQTAKETLIDTGISIFTSLRYAAGIIQFFIKLPNILNDMRTSIQEVLGDVVPEPLFWLIGLIITTTIIGLIIKNIRNQPDMP